MTVLNQIKNDVYPSKDISFPLGNEMTASINFIKIPDGKFIPKEVLDKLPDSFIQRIIKLLSDLFTNNLNLNNKIHKLNDLELNFGNEIEKKGTKVSAKKWKAFLDEMDQVIQFAQRCGLQPLENSELIYQNKELVQKIWAAAELKLKELHLQTKHCSHKTMASCNAIGGSLSVVSVVSKILSLAGVLNPAKFAKAIGDLANPAYKIAGGLQMYSGYEEWKAADQIADKEGKTDGIYNSLDGFFVVLAALSGSLKTLTDFTAPSMASSLFGKLYWGFFGIGSILEIGIATVNLNRCQSFRNKLEAFTENNSLNELEKVLGGLRFILDEITLKPKDLDKLVQSIKESKTELSEEDLNRYIDKKVAELIQRKAARFVRRTGKDSLHQVLHTITDILEGLENKPVQNIFIKKGKELLNHVTKENTKKLMYYSFMLLSAFIVLTACIFINLSTFGAIPALIGCIYAAYLLGSWIKVYLKERKFPNAIKV